jgi:hypothetical protein
MPLKIFIDTEFTDFLEASELMHDSTAAWRDVDS